MDPLSIAASVVAIVQLTGIVIGYLHDIKDAPKDCKQVKVETANLYSLLIRLQCHLEQGDITSPWYAAMRSLNASGGPLDQYLQSLQLLQSKTSADGLAHKLRRMLVWSFNKEAVASIRGSIERLKTLVGIALKMDHL
jgi:hypothetical protein